MMVDDSRENLELAHGDRDYRPRAALLKLHDATDDVIERHGWVRIDGNLAYSPFYQKP